jgi:hypothetical protein
MLNIENHVQKMAQMFFVTWILWFGYFCL